jgi:uncharacterized protein YegL
MPRSKPILFISHIHEDAQIAKCVKKFLDESFLGIFDIFVSSDGASIRAGENWSSSTEHALLRAELVVALITDNAKDRRWIYFECGGAYFARKRVIPVCCRGFKIADLAAPLSWLQAIDGSHSESVERLIYDIAVSCKLRPPRTNLSELVAYLSGTPCDGLAGTQADHADSRQRALPIFFVVDTSGSMQGEPIERLSQALRELMHGLSQVASPQMIPLVSIIAFGNDAREVVPLSPITAISMDFSLPAGGVTSLGAALYLLASRLSDPSSLPARHYRPIILILTDGSPTDDWKAGLAALNESKLGKVANKICIGLGGDLDYAVLRTVAGDSVVSVPDAVSLKGLSNFFSWMSSSAMTLSESTNLHLPDDLRQFVQ